MAQAVTLMIASRPCSILRVGHRLAANVALAVPGQSAFMEHPGENQRLPHWKNAAAAGFPSWRKRSSRRTFPLRWNMGRRGGGGGFASKCDKVLMTNNITDMPD